MTKMNKIIMVDGGNIHTLVDASFSEFFFSAFGVEMQDNFKNAVLIRR